MAEGPILDPLAPIDPYRQLVSRVHALEARVQAIDPMPLVLRPSLPVSTFGGELFWRVAVPSSSFTTLWEARVPRTPHPALYLTCQILKYPGDEIETRVVLAGPGGTVTSAIESPPIGGGSVSRILGWIHNLDLWRPGGDTTLSLQSRRVSGAVGTAELGSPQTGMIDPRGCTLAGTWYNTWMPGWSGSGGDP